MKTILENLRNQNPLVHNMTNYVTVNDCANITLAVGGSPLMADDIGEVEDIVSISQALYLNVGTLNERTVASMIVAGQKANSLGTPVILDPVGAGASELRNKAIGRILETVDVAVVKGNVSELKALLSNHRHSGGVDALESDLVTENSLTESISYAKNASKLLGAIVVITGPIDIVADSQTAYAVYNGHPMMTKITGTGCMTGSLVSAACAANQDRLLESSAVAVSLMGLAGERAYEKVTRLNEGTGSFRRYLIDEVSQMTDALLKEGGRIEKF